jgi:prepilin-type N-terminal cleavage/methylation domain-containing protein
MMRHEHNGFTLLEMALVLVIIGLIVGGVLVGKDLIHMATIRAQISQIDRFNTAANTFKEKYNCLPGDCANATAFFGVDTVDTCPPGAGNPFASIPRINGTCNGDGDGTIAGAACAAGSAVACQEMWRFWQMLYVAGLISEGPFAPTSWVYANVPGVSIPQGKLRAEVGVGAVTYSPGGAGLNCCGTYVNYPDFNNRPTWTIGGQWPTGMLFRGSVTPMEASAIDTKLDDGKPTTGTVRAPAVDVHYNCCANGISYNNSDIPDDHSANWGSCFLVMLAQY